ncbi:unnamed protein product [Arabis nemorensis]|uniref:DUF761 domain-containing protein n=1 Tax=Arabis nemorensis TaxID=586526 RepID=A0A565BBP8_9BRAS|nr:unnamed protein product [Arabis nemorensis]
MALSRFSKKKYEVKRALKRFTKKLRSKFRDLEIAESVRDSTSRLLRVISRILIVPFKTRYLQNTITRTHFNNYYSHGHDKRQGFRFLEFFSSPFAKTKYIRRQSETNYLKIYQYQSQGMIRSEEKVSGRKMEKEEEEEPKKIVDSMEDAWRRVVAASPHLRRVDERASEFIYKFREEMRMEKERSFLEFQERKS